MHVLVIGAGICGLYSTKHLSDAGLQVTIYEKTDAIGGTWVYTEDIDSPETGVKVHSSMYHNLITNLPKEISFLPDFPFPENLNSFITQAEMLDHIRKYADQFSISEKITFQHEVTLVTPYNETKWKVIVHDIKNDKYFTKIFDAVMISSGYFNTPYFSPIPGQNDFKGKIMHSHNYRRGEIFKNQDVLFIGAGPSGRDISIISAEHAKTATLSHRKNTLVSKYMPLNFFQKPPVKRLTATGAEFSDGTFQTFDTICYCTGYTATFPFLSVDCELTAEQNYVRPLYKHTININKPTMAIIGLLAYYTPLQIYDLQARFFVKYLTGEKQMPSKQEMLEDKKKDEDRRKAFGLTTRSKHYLAHTTDDFFNELAVVADVAPLRPVCLMIFNSNAHRREAEELVAYKNDTYQIIDDRNFIRITDGVEYKNP